MAGSDFSVSSMAQSLSVALLNFSPQSGALTIGEVFPPRDTAPMYFDPSYVQITKIAQQQIPPADASEISGALNEVQRWVTDTYDPLKADPSSTPAILNRSVQPLVDTILSGAIIPLLASGPPGFSIFLLAAGVHLALVQELAYTDPAHQTDGAMNSPAAASVRKYAQKYHDVIGLTWGKIKAARLNFLSSVWVPATFMMFTPTSGRLTWSDAFDGAGGSVNASSADAAAATVNAQLAAHRTTVLAALATSLGNPETIAANFLQLVTYPLPFAAPEIVSLSASGGGTVNYDQGYQQKVYAYSLSWNTTGGTVSLDGGVGTVAASGSLSFSNQNSPPDLPSMLTVTGLYGTSATKTINW